MALVVQAASARVRAASKVLLRDAVASVRVRADGKVLPRDKAASGPDLAVLVSGAVA